MMEKIEKGQIWLDGMNSEIEILKISKKGIYPITGYCKSTKQKVCYLKDGKWSESSKFKEFDLKELINIKAKNELIKNS